MLQLCLHLCLPLGWFCSNLLAVSICWALVQLQSSFSAHIFLPEESQWGVLSKIKPGLGGTQCSDPRGSHTTTKSFRVSVTLFYKRKDVKLPRAPIPAWSGTCALGRVICFMWHPFCWWLGSLEPLLPFLPPRLLLAHFPFYLVNAQPSVAVPPCC